MLSFLTRDEAISFMIELMDDRDKLIEASVALIERWETPNWKHTEHTGVFIDSLRNAVNNARGE